MTPRLEPALLATRLRFARSVRGQRGGALEAVVGCEQRSTRREGEGVVSRVLAQRGFWVGVVLCGVALSGCSGSGGPDQATGVGAASKLVFTVQPGAAAAGAAITPALQVAVQDAQGNTVTTATTSITLAIGTNPAIGTLAGTMTVAAVNGVATFSTLSLDKSATG
jgi:hypothetical protein